MPIPEYDLDDEVGRLVFSWTERPEATRTYDGKNGNGGESLMDALASRSILPDEQFDIGRKGFHKAFGINDLTISTHHLRFRCVVYNDDPEDQVAPMVYVRVLSSNAIQLIRPGTQREDNGDTVQRADPDVLLNHGDILQLTPKFSLLFSAVQPCAAGSSGLDDIKAAETKRFRNRFLVSDRKLGSGGQGSVFVAVKQSVGRRVACKIVTLPYTQLAESARLQQNMHLTKQEREAELKKIERRLIDKREYLAREFNILKDLDHPNIIRLEKVICGTYNFYIFQELITGGDLLSYIDQKGALGEPQSAVIVRQILKAVDYLHDKGIVHRDIKPENILMTSWRDGDRIVLTDFGLARTIDDAKAARDKAVYRMRTVVGTHGYTAPEVFQRVKRDLQQEGYSKAIDIWSIGCITATLLTNDLIFPYYDDMHGRANTALSTSQAENSWDINIVDHGERWSTIGRKAKAFVRGCLVLDESQRLTAKQALLDRWFTNKHYSAEMEAVYERAIQDWKPQTKSGNIVQFIDTTDVVPASSRPDHVERLAEEVKSRHFQNLPPPMPMMSAFALPNSRLAPQKRNRTPLPGIFEEFEADRVEVPASPSVTQLHNLFASPLHLPDLTQFSGATANEAMARFSIEDFAPPQTQLTIRQRLPNSLGDFNNSLTQSQLTLDDHSIPSFTIRDSVLDVDEGHFDSESLQTFQVPSAHAHPR